MFDKSEYEFFKNENTNAKFEEFKNLLVEKNKVVNLTSITDDDGVYVKHFFDSLCGEKFIVENSKVIEIGSGGGFPSVPLKILRNDINFTLVEATGKKCAFLNEVKEHFNFDNFNVINGRCEELAKNDELREKFDFCVARAVASLNTLCEYTLPFVKVGGKMLAYKGESEAEIEQAKNAISLLGGKLSSVYKYELPCGMGERSIVIIEKIKKTPSLYPRGRGKERSKPL